MKPKHITLAVIFLSICSANAVESYDGIKLGSSNTVPTGSNSMALGYSNSATECSIVIGDNSTAHGGSLAGGANNTINSESYYSLVYGEENFIGSSTSTTLLGVGNVMALQSGSAAIGTYNVHQTVWGKGGSANIMLGNQNIINQASSSAPNDIQGTVLIGVNNESSSTMAFAFGRGNIAQTDTVTIGTYAETVSNAALIVGKGTNSGARSNGLVVLKNGEVQIAGSLVVGGSPILTQSSAPSYMTGQGFVNTSYLSTNGYLKKANGTGSTAHAVSSLAIGPNSQALGVDSLAIGSAAHAQTTSSVALGNNSTAYAQYSTSFSGSYAGGVYSFATGQGSADGQYSIAMSGFASGESSVAIGGFDQVYEWGNEASGKGSAAIGGYMNNAVGDYSYALGNSSLAFGKNSYSIGFLTRSSAYEVAMGSKNLNSANAMPNAHNTDWLEEGGLFELGNGDPTSSSAPFSNAITTLKNGRTTLTNKAWKVNVAANATQTLADPPDTTDSAGEALVVEGHTRLKGKVIIEAPQGDISMGVYQ